MRECTNEFKMAVVMVVLVLSIDKESEEKEEEEREQAEIRDGRNIIEKVRGDV